MLKEIKEPFRYEKTDFCKMGVYRVYTKIDGVKKHCIYLDDEEDCKKAVSFLNTHLNLVNEFHKSAIEVLGELTGVKIDEIKQTEKPMKEFIVWSSEGHTESPNGDEVENCQVIDWFKAESREEARSIFELSEVYKDCISQGFTDFTIQELSNGGHL